MLGQQPAREQGSAEASFIPSGGGPAFFGLLRFFPLLLGVFLFLSFLLFLFFLLTSS